MINTLVSVIIPVYNVEQYIEECIFSIINQSYDNLEIIIIDDGSTDNSYMICENIAKLDSRIRLFRKENGGLSSARNFGLNYSKGNWIMFIDSDDFIDPDMIRIMVDNIVDSKADLCICNVDKIIENKVTPWEFNKPERQIMNSRTFLKKTFEKTLLLSPIDVISVNKLYKNKIFSNLRFRQRIINEDEEIAHKIFFESNRIIWIPDCLYKYRIRQGSIMTSNNVGRRVDKLIALSDRIEFIIKNKIIKKENLHLDNYYYVYLNLFNKMKQHGIKNVDINIKLMLLKYYPIYFFYGKYGMKEKLFIFLAILFPYRFIS